MIGIMQWLEAALLLVCIVAASAVNSVHSVKQSHPRHQAALEVHVRVKLLGILPKDVPSDKLKGFLTTILPEPDIPRKGKHQTLDAALNYQYDIFSGTIQEVEGYSKFIQEQAHDGTAYRVPVSALDAYLSRDQDVAPSLHAFTVMLVHSDILPKHIIYKEDPNNCIQSHYSSVAFLDMSATACTFPLPRVPDDVAAHTQFHTPIYFHPWPGTFALDKITRWHPVPATDIQNHRIARLGGVVVAAARSFGATNYADIEVDTSRPFFVPIICFQNGVAQEHVHFSVDKIRAIVDQILPAGHTGHILAVTYGVEDIPEAAIAVARSRLHDSTFMRGVNRAEVSTEYSYFDGDVLWSHLQGTVNKIADNMLGAVRQSRGSAEQAKFGDNLEIYPVVVLSDFHHRSTSRHDAARNIQPLFSTRDATQTVANGKVLLALHSHAHDLSAISIDTPDGNYGRWSSVSISIPDTIVADGITKLISGLTSAQLQEYDSSGTMDVTWSRPSRGGDLLNTDPELNALSLWAARRGVALRRVNGLLVQANEFIDSTLLLVNQLRYLEAVSSTGNVSLGNVLGADLRALIFPGLPTSSYLYPMFGDISFPAEANMLLNSIKDSIFDFSDQLKNVNFLYQASARSPYDDFLTMLSEREQQYQAFRVDIEEQVSELIRLLKSCDMEYELSGTVVDHSSPSDISTMWHYAFGGTLLLAALALAIFKFISYVEMKAKKIA